MPSESTEEGTLTLTLPGDLDDWLDERAAQLDVDRETMLVRLLASYRATARLDGDGDAAPVADAEPIADVVEHELERQLQDRLRPIVEATVESVLEDRVEAEVGQQLRTAVESAISDRVDEAVDAALGPLDERVDGLEAECTENLEDVRDRVVQVKRETDAKAPRDHSHEELERVEELADRLADIEETLEDSDPAAEHDELDERITELEDRIQTVAWAVSDLKDAQRTTGEDAVAQIKRSAARADIDTARCENCARGVDISLLTKPECPHCQATLTEVTTTKGLFSKPQLLVASRLESGEDA